MPGYLLDTSSSLLCAHGGQVQATTPSPRVTVAGNPAVTLAAPHSVTGCPFTPGASPMPCVTAQWTVGAVRVASQGSPVLLQDSQAVCAPNGTPVSVLVTQVRVKGA